MKKKILFFVKLIVLTLGLFVFCFLVVMPQYTGNYQAAMLDKVQRLKSTEGPKIVLIGNSNLTFGIDSRMLEEAFGMPVVNMALHAGTGNAFNEQVAKYNVNEGDIYVIAHTNYDDEDIIKNQMLAWITIENHWELYSLIRPEDWPQMIKAYPTYLRKCLTMWRTETGNRESDDCYRRSAFNEYGDIYYPRPESVGGIDFSSVTINHMSAAAANRLNELGSYLEERGAKMVIAAYPVAVYEKTPTEEEYYEMGREMSELLNYPVISDFRDYRIDQSYFYDTHTHLTDEGARIRTEQFIEDLQDYLDGVEKY